MIKIILKLFLLFALLYVVQLYVANIFPPQIDPEILKMQKALDQKKDILYFGDSVVFTSGILPDIVASYLRNPSIGMVAHPADSPIVYLDYCRYLSRISYKPKIIVVPISMRNFSMYWENDPGRQFEEEKLYFRFAKTPVEPFLSFLESFRVLKLYPRSYDEFYKTPFVYKNKYLGTISEYYGGEFMRYSDEHMRKKIMLSYTYQLTPKDFVLDSIRHMVDECNADNVIFYITPVPFSTGEKFLGKKFTTQTEQNINLLKKELAKKHALLVDMSHDVSENDFLMENEFYISEHMTQNGLKDVAMHLANFIRTNHHLN